MKAIIIGGVAGGATAAARLRRNSEAAQIVLVERGPYISFANCGLPYHISGAIAERGNGPAHVIGAGGDIDDLIPLLMPQRRIRFRVVAVAVDEDFARVLGIRVKLLNLLVVILAAVTVTVSMRTVGLLLISALMVIPVATPSTKLMPNSVPQNLVICRQIGRSVIT